MMGVRILEGEHNAVLYCSTSMWAFGPLFEDAAEAQIFLDWLMVDPRGLTDGELEAKYSEFLAIVEKIERAGRE